MATIGIFDLETPAELLEKARHDFKRLQANPVDTYAAFDFFVAARHLPDWLHPNDPHKRAALFDHHVELRICRQLADGAKHFSLTGKQHRQVQETHAQSVWAKNAWGRDVWAKGVWGNTALIVTLDPADPGTIPLGPKINALALAERTLSVLESIVA